MKQLGTRIEGENIITIVELTEYELSVLESLLEKRDLGKELSDIQAWAKRFRDKAYSLNISIRTRNAFARQIWNRERYPEDWTFSTVEDGPPLEFDDWARAIVATHGSEGKPIKHSYPMLVFKNMGTKSRAELMAALIEYVNGLG